MDDKPVLSELDKIKSELIVARNEIQNLRKQITSLSHVHRKDVIQINETLDRFKQESTATKEVEPASDVEHDTPSGSASKRKSDEPSSTDDGVAFKPIGIIRTAFPEKRAVPRQPSLGSRLLGCIQLNKTTFTNPSHAIDGLDGFSHIWILYHFHRNESNTKSKVAPPRLNGERVGVFCTRSPHRPCPIGLSLVEVQSIEDSCIYFLGTDMVDGTPVLDIKPYIPRYDNPMEMETTNQTDHQRNPIPQWSSREEPDGEESNGEFIAGPSSVATDPPVKVKIPTWIEAPASLQVLFNELADEQLTQLGVDRISIVDVMSADPRSVYLRTRYGSQIFTFQLSEVVVTCKFDDANGIVTIVRIRPLDRVTVGDDAGASGQSTGDEENARQM